MLKTLILSAPAILLAQTSLLSVEAFAPAISSSPVSSALHAVNGIWNTAGDFGKGKFRFYNGLDSFMEPFPDEDKQLYPELFKLPKGVYEVPLAKPCGILFEEIESNRGVYVQDLVEGGSAERQGGLLPGDVLVGLTAVQIAGAKWERRMIPARRFGFDLVVNAIGSNDQNWGCTNVILMVERPGEADSEEVDKFLEFFEPPGDTPWKLLQ
mmetsp:Transcript_10778/g.23878  ORF Transcript_10778/g.23878 Transcript_10778/m.23878 type:complete len:211 (-) Transcript_10778:289-921(-)|eukprot:CAMPEP_0172298196 /NCGR_PEP_ID=MMETSP1058-20130122/960_1 /TAXON_ID=83371 /ORGANISM="Detonula confervacea, Strain CCMP 353" /LENGTH=210 /DNA_ID=CAMNT_0013007455 /DNA_START=67 /DNA_END=699 /DNA_ORIENTATION=+